MYICNQALQVGRNGEIVQLGVGDPIPEAAGWPWQTRERYLTNRRIIEVADQDEAPTHRGPGRPRKEG